MQYPVRRFHRKKSPNIHRSELATGATTPALRLPHDELDPPADGVAGEEAPGAAALGQVDAGAVDREGEAGDLHAGAEDAEDRVGEPALQRAGGDNGLPGGDGDGGLFVQREVASAEAQEAGA